MTIRDDLLTAIAREQALIARLERERDEAQTRVRSLQMELGALPGDAASAVPTASADKVALFRSLFRGRDDVFPKLIGYRSSPAPATSGTPCNQRRVEHDENSVAHLDSAI